MNDRDVEANGLAGRRVAGWTWTKPWAWRCEVTRLAALLLLSSSAFFPAHAAVAAQANPPDLAARCADRTAIERVYHSHRTGAQLAFEQLLPPDRIEQLVRRDLQKEEVLKAVYGVEITAAQVEAEAQRIQTTTRAPVTLAELQTALGHDAARFARAVARPIVVERELRQRFENDVTLHAPQRNDVERLRYQLLVARQQSVAVPQLLTLFHTAGSNRVHEVSWQLGPKESARELPSQPDPGSPSTAGGQPASAPTAAKEALPHLDDLPPELRKVVRTQLRGAGDVSGVIETPSEFLLFVAREKKSNQLSAAAFSLPKRDYEAWVGDWRTRDLDGRSANP